MTASHIVIWYIDREKIESERQVNGDKVLSVETLSQGIQRDLGFYNCSRIHIANGYGCAFLDGNLSEIMLDLLKFRPRLKFKIHPAGDINQVAVLFEKMKENIQSPDMQTVLDTSIDDLQMKTAGT